MPSSPSTPSFAGLRVLSFESRRAGEVAALITTYGGRPLVAPALREVTLESNGAALDFAARLMQGDIDIVICLTGVGTRELMAIAERAYPRQAIVEALSRTKVVVRGPKPLAVLRELGVAVWAIAPEPNTWRELLTAMEAKAVEAPIRGARIAVQEYGVPNEELMNGLRERGAIVTRVPVYRWALPEDVGPLKAAIAAAAGGEVDVVIFTTGIQIDHVWQLAQDMRLDIELRQQLARVLVASIGPSTSDALRRHGIAVDVEASHPKFGSLIRELAERSATVLESKRLAASPANHEG